MLEKKIHYTLMAFGKDMHAQFDIVVESDGETKVKGGYSGHEMEHTFVNPRDMVIYLEGFFKMSRKKFKNMPLGLDALRDEWIKREDKVKLKTA